ncbi:MAG: hypothetical protein K2O83_13980, partial [Schaedlerella arabinosiphila]|nr:hypothetical protein [Schaedlerella arabinosiphila]
QADFSKRTCSSLPVSFPHVCEVAVNRNLPKGYKNLKSGLLDPPAYFTYNKFVKRRIGIYG